MATPNNVLCKSHSLITYDAFVRQVHRHGQFSSIKWLESLFNEQEWVMILKTFCFKFQLSGESVITHFTTAVCHYGSCKITDVRYASKNGLYKELEDDILRIQPANCTQRSTCFLFIWIHTLKLRDFSCLLSKSNAKYFCFETSEYKTVRYL